MPDALSFSRRIGHFAGDLRTVRVVMAVGIILMGAVWLHQHPQHNPWAPFDLREPYGLATSAKLQSLRDDVQTCRSVLERSEVAFQILPPDEGQQNQCRRSDKTVLPGLPLSPDRPVASCPVLAAFEMWLEQTVRPAAIEIFEEDIASVEHLGTYSCRRIGNSAEGTWSEHAQGNAIDIAAFNLADGRRISVLDDWNGDDREREFLNEVRDGACSVYSTVLSPEYNAAHRDHFHFDQSERFGGVCR